MIDANELVAAIKRIRGDGYGPPLHLFVPSALPSDVVDVLAQLDIKVVVWDRLVAGKCVLFNAETKEIGDPMPPKSFSQTIREEPAYGYAFDKWKWGPRWE